MIGLRGVGVTMKYGQMSFCLIVGVPFLIQIFSPQGSLPYFKTQFRLIFGLTTGRVLSKLYFKCDEAKVDIL